MKQNSIGKEKAVELYDSCWWEFCDDKEAFEFQFYIVESCMPFAEFQRVAEVALNRSVWTHEFANLDTLEKEYMGERPAPTTQEIIDLIPEDKRFIIKI